MGASASQPWRYSSNFEVRVWDTLGAQRGLHGNARQELSIALCRGNAVMYFVQSDWRGDSKERWEPFGRGPLGGLYYVSLDVYFNSQRGCNSSGFFDCPTTTCCCGFLPLFHCNTLIQGHSYKDYPVFLLMFIFGSHIGCNSSALFHCPTTTCCWGSLPLFHCNTYIQGHSRVSVISLSALLWLSCSLPW